MIPLNREQQRKGLKGKIVLANLLAVLGDGSVVQLDTTKVAVIDIATSKPLFNPTETK